VLIGRAEFPIQRVLKATPRCTRLIGVKLLVICW